MSREPQTPEEGSADEMSDQLVMERPRVALQPLLKWAGGKRWQVPYIAALWAGHEHRRLVEPFCGGMSIALGLRPDRALLNDVNPHLMNFYRQVQRSARPFPSFLNFENDADCYYGSRAWFNELIATDAADSDTAAGLFYYLNKTGFNGLCRFNASGGFNVPFGKFKSINYVREFPDHHEQFKAWMLMNVDVARVPFEPGDFVYADPPYDVEFTAYSQGGFTWADQERTTALLAEHRGPVVLVNQATPRVEALYRDHGFTVRFLDAPRRISCTGDRTPAREILATRNL